MIYHLLQILLNPLHRLNHILAMTEGRKSEEPFAARPETGTRRADDVAFIEEFVEEVPGAQAARRLEPDVGGVDAAVAGDAGSGETFTDDPGILHVVVDDLLGLLPPLLGVDGSRGALHRVGGAVELGGGAAQPELVEGVLLARARRPHDLFRHDHQAAADAGETGSLGEGAELDGALLRPFDLVDGVRDLGVGDKGLVGGVEEDHRVVGIGVVDPLLELGLGGDGAGRVVGEAEVDDVDLRRRQGGDEVVRLVAGEVDDILVVALVVGFAGAADHDVGVVVDRVDRVADGDDVVEGEDVEDVGAVALGAVGDEHLGGLELDAEGLVALVDDGVDQPVIPLLRAVAGELVGGAEVVDGGVEGLEDGRGEGAGDVADAEADDLGARVGGGEFADAAADLGEEVAGFEFEVVVVDLGHYGKSSGIKW